MIDRPLPKTGQWYIRKNRDNKSARLAEHPTDIVQIGEIDAAKEKIETRRFDGYDGSKPIFGRITSVSFETWHKEGRYTETHEPVPAMLDRDGALRMLRALGFDAAEELLVDPRDHLTGLRADPDIPRDDPTIAILAAHVAHLDAHSPAVTPPDGMPVTEIAPEAVTADDAADDGNMSINTAKKILANIMSADDGVIVATAMIVIEYVAAAEENESPKVWHTATTLAALRRKVSSVRTDVLAAIETLRAEVRADRKPLLDAVDRVLENHGPYGSESDAVEVHLDAFKALRDARSKV